MNFIYTSCPGACHLQNFDLLMVRKELNEASRQGLALVSISFDPEVDTPKVLKEYAPGSMSTPVTRSISTNGASTT